MSLWSLFYGNWWCTPHMAVLTQSKAFSWLQKQVPSMVGYHLRLPHKSMVNTPNKELLICLKSTTAHNEWNMKLHIMSSFPPSLLLLHLNGLPRGLKKGKGILLRPWKYTNSNCPISIIFLITVFPFTSQTYPAQWCCFLISLKNLLT